MGIIIRLYHRSEGLEKNRFNTFFMDMGENIHVHYRDLRIEFNVDEFIEFADLCETYIPQVRKEIEGGFKDGVNPNTNQSDTIKTFFNKKPLKQTIVYNPTRISLEENTDGFHIHLRNYKMLLDKPSFLNFARAAKEVLEMRERPVDLAETLNLIEINELHHRVEETGTDGGKETAHVVIDQPYYKKLLQLFDGLGYKKADPKKEIYEIEKARISLKIAPGAPKPMPKQSVKSPVVPLPAYLAENAKRFNSKELNLLKLQVLDFFEYARKNALGEVVELNHQNMLFNTETGKVIFPSKIGKSAVNITQEWTRFDQFLNKHGIGFVKPNKIIYNEEQLKGLDEAFRYYVKEHVSRHPAVRKVYLLNPMQWKKSGSQTGRYEVPFLHIAWAKLGSDFDILIEVDERYPVPESWDLKFFWKVCGCDYYHLGEVDFPIDNPYAKDYPNIPFGQHLVEAYLFFGSRMDAAVKDKYLSGFPSREVLYEKQDVLGQLPAFVAERYGIALESIDPLKGVSFNEVFRAKGKEGEYIVKVMKGAEFTPPVEGHRGTHLRYETYLLQRLADAKAPAIVPRPGTDGKLTQPMGENNVMLLDFITADKVGEWTNVHLMSAASTVAQVNKALPKDAATTDSYRFKESLEFWLHDYAALLPKFTEDVTLRQQFESLIPKIEVTRQRLENASDIPWIHCHGDVTPRNIMFVKGEALLYDFQAARFSPRLEDVAEGGLEFAFIDKEARIDAAKSKTFIDAYEQEYPLSEAERALLPSMMFLHAAIKLGRLLRMQVVFGNKVNMNLVRAFLDYALANADSV
ncbi:MAG: phosphotransferase [Alphaproteobacteria bacterium]|nr:phosphotransferase [Alphaproteobacteria bacterium]